jgi:hypothetical protein
MIIWAIISCSKTIQNTRSTSCHNKVHISQYMQMDRLLNRCLLEGGFELGGREILPNLKVRPEFTKERILH